MKNILLLFFVGLFFVCAEIFLPGIVAGAIGTLCILGSVILCYATLGAESGSYFLLFAGITTGLGIWAASKFFPRTKFGKSFTLQSDQTGYKAATVDPARWLNKTGVAVSYLRPSGIAMIDQQRLDVVSEGGFIEQGSKIRVVQVEGNRIIVAKAE